MPTIHVPAKVLVTGASGFIGSWVTRLLLDHGYHVRATVRTPEKGEYLVDLFNHYSDAFEYVLVENIEKEGAFDDVLQGIDAVEHIASHLAGHPDDLIPGAIGGTSVLLNSVLDHGSSVKRVIITSSGAALMEPKEPGHVYNESDWNEFSLREVEAKGKDADTIQKYRASKTLAEKFAWDFVEKHKDRIGWDLLTVLPTIVYGPIIHQVESLERLNYSCQLLYNAVLHERKLNDVGGCWVDVRDVAQVHLEVLEKMSAGGQRLIVSAGVHSWQELYDSLNASIPPLTGIPKGDPGNPSGTKPPYVFSSAKVIKLLGIHFKSLRESARDTVVSIRERGL